MRENNRRFIFFVNPRTRHGRAGKQLVALQVRSVGPPLRGETAIVRSLEDMRRYLDSAPPDMIGVACGGDGTVQALARALIEAGDLDRTMGTLPFGYGNAFACSLGIRSIDEAVRVLHEGEIRRLDIMTTDHPQTPVVLVSLSVGFESLFIEKYASLRVLPRPAGALLGLLAAAGRSYRGIRLELQAEIVLDPEESVYNAGLYNLLRDVPRTATVRATTACQLFALERADFLAAVTGGRVMPAADAEIDRRLAELDRMEN